jgi:signal transduction histidine kinase
VNSAALSTSEDAQAGRQQDRLRAIIERLPDGIVVVDREGNIRFVNPAAERLFARRANELIGNPFGFSVVAGETTEIDIVQRGGAEIVFAELRVVDTEWENEPVELVALRDCTDRKRSEERARQLTYEREARLEAEAMSQAKSDFLAIMSHELRTPLNAVLGYSELMELGIAGPINDKQREQLGRIRLSSKHLLGLVNQLLDLAKVEAGRLSVQSAPSSSADALDAAVALLHPQAEAKGLDLADVRPPGNAPVYIGDESRVRQILINLLSNAVKFTPPGGRISIETGVTDKTEIGARLHSDRRYVFFRITDTGIGIPEDKLIAVFDPFVQAESGTTRSIEGSGLGLTISRRLARLMGGDLTVRSKVGEGSTFTLCVPAESVAVDASDAPADVQATPVSSSRTEGLRMVGEALMGDVMRLVDSIVERIRTDPSLRIGAGVQYTQLADHLGTFIADVAGALIIMNDVGGRPSPLLADATEIQRLISERHGSQRQRLGWTESTMRREFMIIREELESFVRRKFRDTDAHLLEDSIGVLDRFLDQAEYVGVRALEATKANPE